MEPLAKKKIVVIGGGFGGNETNFLIVVYLVELCRRTKLLIEIKSSSLPFSILSILKNEVL